MPTLVIQAAQDAIAPVAVGEYVRDALPDSTFVLLDTTGPLPAPQRTRRHGRGDRGVHRLTRPATTLDRGRRLDERRDPAYLRPDGTITEVNETFLDLDRLPAGRAGRAAKVRGAAQRRRAHLPRDPLLPGAPHARTDRGDRTRRRRCRRRAAPRRSSTPMLDRTPAATRRRTARSVPRDRAPTLRAGARRGKQAGRGSRAAGDHPGPDAAADPDPDRPRRRCPGWTSRPCTGPPATGDEVGGDFYDVFEVSEGDWVAVVGDVCGKGAEAAVVTAAARHTLRALTVRGSRAEPGAQAAQRRAARRRVRTRFCTVALVRLRRSTGSGPSPCRAGATPSRCSMPRPPVAASGTPVHWSARSRT